MLDTDQLLEWRVVIDRFPVPLHRLIDPQSPAPIQRLPKHSDCCILAAQKRQYLCSPIQRGPVIVETGHEALKWGGTQRVHKLKRSTGVSREHRVPQRESSATESLSCSTTVRSEERRVGKECRSR